MRDDKEIPVLSRLSGHFVEGAQGSLFVVLRQPSSSAVGSVLVVPAFAEEMNKSRRMVAEVSSLLALKGIATVVPDLTGTGDSSGDFVDASIAVWLDDLSRVQGWCKAKGLPIVGILAVRFGAALATAALSAAALAPVARTVLWQPVFDGSRFCAQFLRLRSAAAMMSGDRKETVGELRRRLLDGESLEVAGYRISRQLAQELDVMLPPASLPPGLGRVDWIEVLRADDATLPTPSATLVERSRSAGVDVTVRTYVAEPFWASTEVVRIVPMLEATANAFASALVAGGFDGQ